MSLIIYKLHVFNYIQIHFKKLKFQQLLYLEVLFNSKMILLILLSESLCQTY